MSKFIEIKTDFGTVEFNDELETAFKVVERAADTLQVTNAEMMGILLDAVIGCPKCRAGTH